MKKYIYLIRLLFRGRGQLVSLLAPILLSFGKEAGEELLAAANQVVAELLSADGLTKAEARAIAEERLRALIAEEIADPVADDVIDFLLTLILKRVAVQEA